MIDREKVLAVLAKRFPTASLTERAAAANAIVGLNQTLDGWEEVTEALFEKVFALSPVRRTGWKGWKRNIDFVRAKRN